MPQYARPSSDIDSVWTCSTGTSRFSLIDESTASDTDWIASSFSTNHSQTCGLGSITDPIAHTGHTIRVRAKLEQSPPVSSAGRLTYTLYQGDTSIFASADKTFAALDTWYDFSDTLTEGQAANITSYSTLRLKVQSINCGAAYRVVVSFAEFEVPIPLPTVTTQSISNNVGATATGNGTLVNLGEASVSQHGHVWDTSTDPTTALSTKTELGSRSTTGTFTSNLSGLTPGTTYYVRAYATNTTGTAYGSNISFVSSKVRQGVIWMEGSNLHGFDENAIERTYIHTGNVDDAPVNGETTDAISSNWAYDHVAAADPHTGYVLESLFDAQTIIAATSDNTPTARTINEQQVVARLTGGNIAGINIGISDDYLVQIDDAAAADNEFAKFTANGLEGRTYAETLSDLSGQAAAPFSFNSQNITNTGTIQAATSVWWSVYHLDTSSLNPGLSGATFTSPDANSAGGWQLDASTELLNFDGHVHDDWDGASDPIVEILFEVNVDNTAGGAGDTVDLRLQCFYKGIGETSCKSQTVEVATTVGQSARYKQFKVEMPVDFDAISNVVDVEDDIGFILNLETDTSEVDNIILTHATLMFKTKKVNPEV